ncbi:Monocarboxylate transporter [Wickerhamomyces ciferrii]|uniref:Monocarboxylate transporter n=1 Tax=Wickerhamomyces ciferrii (strain ATCC 14091 / BCRC 22168 / CBS 111 / JCM 3599 / NBRC 0793 / NRRL Y-1031 F-60-10) TaxID=1206466 RepID=K0KE37_WICCF|nr:Monocarboxylate transporter [Wickerhamomyces ciferrii]CCH40507.1 Monocarboxylate transporter [Wickerhamomyces ciferrii]
MATINEYSDQDQYDDDIQSITHKECKDFSSSNTHTGEADEQEYPEGGRGWLVILGCGIGSLLGFGMINTYGAFQTYYETELFPKTSSQSLSLVGACQASFLYFFTPLFTPLVHAFGIRQVLIAGCSLMVIGIFGLSTTNEGELWKCYLFQAVLYSLGSACVFTSVMMSPLEWFKKKRASAFAANFIFVGVGGIVWPLIFKHMIKSSGFKWTVRTMAFIYIPLSIGVIILIPQRLDEKYVYCYNNISNSRWNNQKIKDLPNAYLKMLNDWFLYVQNWRFALMLLSNVIGSFAVYPAIFYLDYFGNIIAPKAQVSSYLVVLYNAMGIVGRIAPAVLADKMGRTNVLMIWIGIAGVSLLAIWIPAIQTRSIDIYVGFVTLFGFTVGAYFSLFPACVGQLFGLKGSQARFGLFMMLATPGPLIGCLIAGSFIPKGSNSTTEIVDAFYKLVIFSGVMLMADAFVLSVVRLSISKKLLAFV